MGTFLKEKKRKYIKKRDEDDDVRHRGNIVDPVVVKIDKKPKKIPLKQAVFKLLRDNGVTVKDAAKVLGYNTNYAYRIVEPVKKYDLTDSGLVSKAHRNLKKLMDGKAFGTIEKVKCSTSLAANCEVLDRAQPKITKIQSESIALSVTADPKEMAQFQCPQTP